MDQPITLDGVTPGSQRGLWRAVAVLGGVAALGACILAVAGHGRAAAVVGAVAAGLVLAWATLARTQWTIGASWVARRGLLGSVRLDLAALRRVTVPAGEVGDGDLVFCGPGLRSVAVPADRVRSDARLAAAVATLLRAAQDAGVRVADEAWSLVGVRPATVVSGAMASGAMASGAVGSGAVVASPAPVVRRTVSAA